MRKSTGNLPGSKPYVIAVGYLLGRRTPKFQTLEKELGGGLSYCFVKTPMDMDSNSLLIGIQLFLTWPSFGSVWFAICEV